MADHPYSDLPEDRYWRRAVAGRAAAELSGLYSPKFEIGLADPIAAAGSCFAQHIARRLAGSGYRFLDVEPAPEGLPEDQAQRFGYGLYSARYGNIYTARQLLQLAERALDGRIPVGQWHEAEGRWFDLLRPTVEPGGFSSRVRSGGDAAQSPPVGPAYPHPFPRLCLYLRPDRGLDRPA